MRRGLSFTSKRTTTTVSMNLKVKKPKLKIGKEYWVLQQFATLEAIVGSTAVCRNRWDQQFEVDVGEVQDKPKN